MKIKELLYKLQQLDPEAKVSITLFDPKNDAFEGTGEDYWYNDVVGVTVDEGHVSITDVGGDI